MFSESLYRARFLNPELVHAGKGIGRFALEGVPVFQVGSSFVVRKTSQVASQFGRIDIKADEGQVQCFEHGPEHRVAGEGAGIQGAKQIAGPDSAFCHGAADETSKRRRRRRELELLHAAGKFDLHFRRIAASLEGSSKGIQGQVDPALVAMG